MRAAFCGSLMEPPLPSTHCVPMELWLCLVHFVPARSGVGRTGGEPPNLQISPDEYGGTARAPKGLARGTGWRVPGMVRSPHAADVMQPRVHFRMPDSILWAGIPGPARDWRPRTTSPCVVKPVRSGIRDWHGTSGFRFNDSTGDGPLPPEWAQDRVSQGPRGSPCNNLPSLVGKSRGQCRDCYRAATIRRRKEQSRFRKCAPKRTADRVQYRHFVGRLKVPEWSVRSAFCGVSRTKRAFCDVIRKVVA